MKNSIVIRTIENKRELDSFTRMFISETNDTKMELKVKDLGKQDLFLLLNSQAPDRKSNPQAPDFPRTGKWLRIK